MGYKLIEYLPSLFIAVGAAVSIGYLQYRTHKRKTQDLESRMKAISPMIGGAPE